MLCKRDSEMLYNKLYSLNFLLNIKLEYFVFFFQFSLRLLEMMVLDTYDK